MTKSDLFTNYLFANCYLVCKYVYLIKYEKKPLLTVKKILHCESEKKSVIHVFKYFLSWK